ncbi:MAG: quinone-dependent dihydroorotate dehydrogenase [Patescibacteria group bacterium]|nr:quinone-dependent dihydroorotate dehydrogenase [Patescibacteria group bacterium]
MKDLIITIRNWQIRFFYKGILKPILFKIDPEKVHDRAINIGKLLGKYFLTKKITGLYFNYRNKALNQNILGIDFKNPIGLAAGFDKNADLIDLMPYVGFGFIEIGSITGEPCAGNPKPRLWRIPEHEGLIVYYGLKNEGAEVLSKKLSNRKFKIPVGVSVAKTNCSKTIKTEAGIKDYAKAYKLFNNIGSYTNINISCPNTYGGQPFTDSKKLEALLGRILSVPKKKPIFLKMSPDLEKKEIDEIINVATRFNIDGFICTNLTKKTNLAKKGGVSGKKVSDISTKLINYIYKKTNGEFVIIGVGGIFTAKDAYQKIKAGASLLQLITGMIYEGPQNISEINRGLVKLLKKDGYSNISEAIGN